MTLAGMLREAAIDATQRAASEVAAMPSALVEAEISDGWVEAGRQYRVRILVSIEPVDEVRTLRIGVGEVAARSPCRPSKELP